MNTTLLVNLSGQTYERIDLYEDIPISVVIQSADINSLDTRKSPYSKQFVVPNTSSNAKLFEFYFEVNGTEFNPLTKIPCVVQYRGVDIFTGIFRLSAVINNPNYTDYEVYIMGDVGDFASEIRNTTLQDLSWTDLQHELAYSSITKSWLANSGDTAGLFGGKILYPMINYGLPYISGATSGGTPVFTYSFNEPYSFDQSTHPVPESIWKPAIRIKEVINRIFAKTNYQINSDFFESKYFRSLYMDTFTNGNLGVTVASAVTNQNIFKLYTNASVVYNAVSGLKDFLAISFRADGYDPLNNFTEAVPYNSIDPGNQPTKAYFGVPFGGQYAFNVRFNYDDNNQCGGDVKFQVIMKKSRNPNAIDIGTTVAASDEFQLPTCGRQASVNWFPTVILDAGDYVKVYIQINNNIGGNTDLRLLPYNFYGVTSSAPMWDLYTSPTLQGTQIVDIGLGLQAINCMDYLKGLVTLFNLIIVQDETNKTLRIEPWNWYFNDPDRQIKDYTQRLDLDSTYRIEPLSFDLAKIINLQYEIGTEEFLNKTFEDANKFTYGRYRYVSTNNLLTSEQDYTVPFAALPTSGVTNAPNFIIPMAFRNLNQQQQPYSNKPHLFFWVGNRYAYLDQNKNIQGSWYLSSGTTQIEQTTYPCVSHLSSLDIYLPSLVSDMNFASTFDYFGNQNTLPVQFTDYNLWNTFWGDYITNNYSNETRRLTGRFYIRPTDIPDLDITDKIWVKDAYYRIEKLNEASLVEQKLTDCSMIKEPYPYYKVVPPSPYYLVGPNQPYPGVTPSYNIDVYSATTSTPVCNGTAPTTTVVSFGSLTLTNGISIYVDFGGYYGPLPQGTFIRQVGFPTTYVCYNNLGQIIQYDC